MEGKVVDIHVIIRWCVWSTGVSVAIPELVWLTKRARERWGLNARHVGRLSARFAVVISITSSGKYASTATSLLSITIRVRKPLGLLDRNESIVTRFEILRQEVRSRLTSANGESSWSSCLSLINRVLTRLGNTESKVTLRTLGANHVRSAAASDM